jgi:hypothetical protein
MFSIDDIKKKRETYEKKIEDIFTPGTGGGA